jgi:hypothetical protein
MAFVEAVGSGKKETPVNAPGKRAATEPKTEPSGGNPPPPEGQPAGPDAERKKFVKKY